jgi:hypothetical protein
MSYASWFAQGPLLPPPTSHLSSHLDLLFMPEFGGNLSSETSINIGHHDIISYKTNIIKY